MDSKCPQTSQEVIASLISRYPDMVSCEAEVRSACALLTSAFRDGKKLLVCGNGGSAADSEHTVGELMKSFRFKRPVDDAFLASYRDANGCDAPEWLEGALPAISLVSHTALSTAFGNDEASVGVFAQQVYGYGQPGDVLLAISTSGNSANVVEAAKVARAKGVKVIGLTGSKESRLALLSDVCVRVPRDEVFQVQELHLPVYHCLCACTEADLFGASVGSSAYRGTAGRTREAVILAGGFGTRLAHVVPDVCKPMAPVAGEPFLRRVLDQLDAAGFARVVVADGYRRKQIEDYFMGTYRGLEVDYSPEDTPLLTGGAVKRALAACTQPEVFVLNGDTWLDADFTAMEETLSAHPEASCCIAAKRMVDLERYGTLEVDVAGSIRSFREKAPCAEGLINGGTYLVRRGALQAEPDVFSLENDWFARVVSDGALVACEAKGGFIDIGVPEDYERAQAMFDGAGEGCRLALFDRDGTINVDAGHMHRIEDCVLIESTVELMRRYSEDPAWRIAVVTNQAGIAKGMYAMADMRLLHRRMAQMLSERGVEVDAWYFCPHHPDFTGECACRKPKPGMLERAMRDFRSDPAQCVMYGDSEKDELAAKAVGVDFVQAKE